MANSIYVWRILVRLGNYWDADQADFRTLDYPGKLRKYKSWDSLPTGDSLVVMSQALG